MAAAVVQWLDFRTVTLRGLRAGEIDHRINAGDYPRVRGLSDFFLFPGEEAEGAARLTVDVVTKRIPARFGLDPRRDIQVRARSTLRGGECASAVLVGGARGRLAIIGRPPDQR